MSFKRTNRRDRIEEALRVTAQRSNPVASAQDLAGRRAWETWCERGNNSPPTQPESEWLALGGLLS